MKSVLEEGKEAELTPGEILGSICIDLHCGYHWFSSVHKLSVVFFLGPFLSESRLFK